MFTIINCTGDVAANFMEALVVSKASQDLWVKSSMTAKILGTRIAKHSHVKQSHGMCIEVLLWKSAPDSVSEDG